MAISHVGTGTVHNVAVVTATFALPAGVTTGDLLILPIRVSSSTATMTTPPAGWTLVGTQAAGTDGTLWVYAKIAGASESAPSCTISATATVIGAVTALRGASTTLADLTAVFNNVTGTFSDPVVSAMTPDAAGAWSMIVVTSNSGTPAYTPVAGYTTLWSQATPEALVQYDDTTASGTAQGPYTVASGTSRAWITAHLIVKQAAAAAAFVLSGSAAASAATGSGAGLVRAGMAFVLSGSAAASAATGSGAGLAVGLPAFALHGSARSGAATGSGAGLVSVSPIVPAVPPLIGEIVAGIAAQLRTIPELKAVYTSEPDQAGPLPMVYLEPERWDHPEKVSQEMALGWDIPGYLVLAGITAQPEIAARRARRLIAAIIEAAGQDIDARGALPDGQVLLTEGEKGRLVVGGTQYYARRLVFRAIERFNYEYAL